MRIWANSNSEARITRALGIVERYRNNATRAGYPVKDGKYTATVQIPRRVYMGLSNG